MATTTMTMTESESERVTVIEKVQQNGQINFKIDEFMFSVMFYGD